MDAPDPGGGDPLRLTLPDVLSLILGNETEDLKYEIGIERLIDTIRLNKNKMHPNAPSFSKLGAFV